MFFRRSLHSSKSFSAGRSIGTTLAAGAVAFGDDRLPARFGVGDDLTELLFGSRNGCAHGEMVIQVGHKFKGRLRRDHFAGMWQILRQLMEFWPILRKRR